MVNLVRLDTDLGPVYIGDRRVFLEALEMVRPGWFPKCERCGRGIAFDEGGWWHVKKELDDDHFAVADSSKLEREFPDLSQKMHCGKTWFASALDVFAGAAGTAGGAEGEAAFRREARRRRSLSKTVGSPRGEATAKDVAGEGERAIERPHADSQPANSTKEPNGSKG